MSSAIDPSPEFLRAVRRRLAAVAGRSKWWTAPSLTIGSLDWLGLGFWLAFVMGFVVVVHPARWGLELEVPPGIQHVAKAFLLECFLWGMTYLILSQFTSTRHHLAYTIWPASETEVVQRIFRRTLIETLSSGFVIIVVSAAVPSLLDRTFDPRILVLGAVCLPVAVIRTWVANRWRWFHTYSAGVWWLTATVGLGALVIKPFRPPLLEFLTLHGDAVALLFPAGWIILPWSAWIEGGPWILASFALPLPVVLLGSRLALDELRRALPFRDRTLFYAFGEIPEYASEGFSQAVQAFRSAVQASHRPGPTANADAIQDREFLRSPLETPTRWVDRMAWRWWTPAQRLAAECLVRTWPRGRRFRGLMLGAIPIFWGTVAWASRTAGDGLKNLTLVAVLIAVAMGLRRWLIPWCFGFGRETAGRKATLLPIGLWDIALLRLKYTVLCCAVSLPIAGVAIAGAFWFAWESPWIGAALGAEIGLQLAVAPVFVSPFSTIYSLLNKAHVRGAVGLTLKAAAAVAYVFNAIGFLLLFVPVLGLVFGLLCFGFNTLLLAAVIRWFDACRIDLP